MAMRGFFEVSVIKFFHWGFSTEVSPRGLYMMRRAVAPALRIRTLHSNGPGESIMNGRSALLALGMVVVGSFQGLAAQEKPIAIVHARIIDGVGGPPTEDGTVILRGSKIEYTGPSARAAIPRDAQIIDAKGKSV